jgi:hypothetical protein
MKKLIKTILIFSILFCFSNSANAQNRVFINHYGTFLVENGKIQELHTEQETWGAFFWENYLILGKENSSTCRIYNRDTGVFSDWINGNVIQLERVNNLCVYVSLSTTWVDNSGRSRYDPVLGRYCIFEFESTTLELKNKIPLHERPFPELKQTSFLFDFEENIHFQPTTEEIIDDRLYRYIGQNFNLDINYGPAIDLTGNYWPYNVSGGKDNIFVVSLHKITHYK